MTQQRTPYDADITDYRVKERLTADERMALSALRLRQEGYLQALEDTAAPDLLAALQTIANTPCNHGQPFCPRETVRAAVAKATSPEVTP